MYKEQDCIFQNIQKIRIKKGIKVENISKEIGKSVSEYSKIENGE